MDGVTEMKNKHSDDTANTGSYCDSKSYFSALKTSLSGSCHTVTRNSLLKKEEVNKEREVGNIFLYIGCSETLVTAVTPPENLDIGPETQENASHLSHLKCDSKCDSKIGSLDKRVKHIQDHKDIYTRDDEELFKDEGVQLALDLFGAKVSSFQAEGGEVKTFFGDSERIAVCHIRQGAHSDFTPQGERCMPLKNKGKPVEFHFPCQSESDIPEEYEFIRWF